MELQFKGFSKQIQALNRLRDMTTNEVLYGGGARGGKSYLGCAWVILASFEMPGSHTLIAREELSKMRDTTIKTFKQVLKEMGLLEDIHFKFNDQTLTCDLYAYDYGKRQHEVSTVFFREIKFIPSDPEFDRLGSYDLTRAFIDEAQQINKKAISVLRGRFSTLQKMKPDGTLWWKTVPKMLFTCNPTKNWIYTEYVKPDRDGKMPFDRVFIKSLATDNPYISKEYIENLKKSDKVTVERLLYGNFEYDDAPNALLRVDDVDDMWLVPILKKPIKYMSVDVARFGSDFSVQYFWHDWALYSVKVHFKISTSTLASIIEMDCKNHGIPRRCVIVDESGVGGGVIDQVRGVRGFIGNARAEWQENPRYENLKRENFENLRSQCIYKISDKIKDREVSIACDPPIVIDGKSMNFKDMLSEELAQWKVKYVDNDNRKIGIIPKDEIKEAIGRSPDFSDALMMRYYFELKHEYQMHVMTESEAIEANEERQTFNPFEVV